MLAEAGQAAVEAAKSGSITVAIPTAVFTSILTGLAIKLPDIIAKVKRKPRNGNGTKPGMGEECLKHRDKITTLETKQDTTDQLLGEVRDDVKEILRRVAKA